MSMHNYAEHLYGLYLTDDEFCELFGVKDKDEEWCQVQFEMVRLTDMESGFLYPLKEELANNETDAEDNLFIFPLDHFPSLYKAAYGSYEEIKKEFQDKLSEYLPADFDYDSHLVEYRGVSFA